MDVSKKKHLITSAKALTEKADVITLPVLEEGPDNSIKMKRYKIVPASIGTLIKISGELLSFPTLDANDTGEGNVRRFTESLLCEAPAAARVIAHAIVNREKEASEKLIGCLVNNLTASDLLHLSVILFKGMDTTSYEEFYQLDKKRKKKDEDKDEAPAIDTVWTLIGIICKYWKWSQYEVKWQMSYQNAMMYLKTIPVYDTKIERTEKGVKEMPDEVDSAADFMKLGLK